MASPDLSLLFSAWAAKRLTRVEVDSSSNQHEFQGVKSLRKVLGVENAKFDSRFIYLGEDDLEATIDSSLTWYDARARARAAGSRRSPEWHAYYPAAVTLIQELAKPGDLLVILRKHDGSLVILILQRGSVHEANVLWLLGLADDLDEQPQSGTIAGNGSPPPFAARRALIALGLEEEAAATKADSTQLASLLREHPDNFPSTRAFAEAARAESPGADAVLDPDGALVAWFSAEERLFKGFERPWLERQLAPCWDRDVVDVDAVVETMKSALQRRRSRAGTAVELHLEHIFNLHKLRFSRNAITEAPSRPDFIFPSENEYSSATRDEFKWLTMLGVKSTAKDRWRQVLAEADRVEPKHLFTLEPGITLSQRTQMKREGLRLVVPRELHSTYTLPDPLWVLSLVDFIHHVKERETHWRR